MPFEVKGIGTKYYGKRNLKRDGTFITTEWFILFHLPIIPIGSFRIRPTGNSTNLVLLNSTEYYVKPIPLCWKQVRNVYLTTIITLGILFIGIMVLLNIYL